MPDISMCPSTRCPNSSKCYRHEDSGTAPSESRQSWFVGDSYYVPGTPCPLYWPVKADIKTMSVEEFLTAFYS